MLKLALCASVIVAAAAAVFIMPVTSQAADIQAFGIIRDTEGRTVGLVTFTETASRDVTVSVEVGGLPPGLHGMHIHAIGACVPSDFASAGGHFNPDSRKHGLQTSDGAHAGDLPNLVVGTDGRGHFQMTIANVTLSPGRLGLFDVDGSAFVIHAQMDDGVTDATGNSGARISCGVITSGSAPQTSVPTTVPAVAPPRTGDAGLAELFVCHEARLD